MRFIHLYLVGYFVLIIGAAMALYQSGVLARMSAMWIAISLSSRSAWASCWP